MTTTHSAATAVPSVPEITALPPNSAVGGHMLPQALPGQRAAMRLLDVVDQLVRHTQQLERRLAQSSTAGPIAGPTPVTESSSQNLLALQRENAVLKSRQLEARRRLEALLQRVQAAQATAEERAENENHAEQSATQQEVAAQ